MLRAACALGVVSVIAFYWWPIVIGLGAALAALAVAANVERRELKQALARISVARSLPSIVGRGTDFVARLRITNGNQVPVQGEVRDVVPKDAVPALAVSGLSLAGGQTSLKEGIFRIPRRGRHEFGPIWIRLRGPWELLEAQQPLPCMDTIKVLPETFSSPDRFEKDIGAEARLLDQIQRSRQHGSGTEFESLQPFRLGDDPRRIDWRATARQQSLVVRHFQVERHRDVMIIIDSGRLMGAEVGRGSKLDCAVDSALNLARVVLQSGDRCGVAAYDRQVLGFLPPLAGTNALRSMAECIYDLQTQWHESDFTSMLAELRHRQAKRTFLIILSDLGDAETSRRTCGSLIQLQRQHLVLFAALRTPLLGRVVRDSISDAEDVSRKVVAFRLLRDRRRALHTLSHNGVHVVDVEPTQLTVPLVNQFIELRQRNLL
jgi:uncharacterized protein (DUF58 family)